MTAKEAINHRNNIYEILSGNRVGAALAPITELIEDSAVWQLIDELNALKLEYRYMLDYFMSGASDPERGNMHRKFLRKLFVLTDKATNAVLTREDYSLYYGVRRVEKKNPRTIDRMLQDYSKAFAEIALYGSVQEAEQDAAKLKELLEGKERMETEIFKSVWTSFPRSAGDAAAIKSIFESEEYPQYFKSLMISAVLLSLMQYYSDDMLVLLLACYDSDDVELSMRALCAVLMAIFLHARRAAQSDAVQAAMKALADNERFVADVKSVLYLLIRSKKTEQITKKIEDELMPRLMKIYPKVFKKFKSGSATIDMSDLEGNPEWQEMMDESGLSKKIEEFGKMQMEGGDVFIGTFSHLKSFPFFNEIGNWFMPFHSDHTMVKASIEDKDVQMLKPLLDVQFFCDSDKYSFVASLASVPQSQRAMMMSHFEEQNSALKELKSSELPSASLSRESVAKLYVQNLYRFFKLYPRKSEFSDPFACPFDISGNELLTSHIDLTETISMVGEFYFKNGYYREACDYFNAVYAVKPDYNAQILQKIGFCHQNMEHYHEAIEYYKKYELLADKNLWNLRHLAACYRALKQPETALKYYSEAEGLAPDNTSLCLNIGHCLLELERCEEALKYYYKVYYIEPASPKVWRPIAWCLFVQGNYEQSRSFYEKIIGDRPTGVDYLNFGHLAFVEGKVAEAIGYYKQALEKENNSVEKFMENFMADEASLVSNGVKKSDIYILLDALSAERE